MPAVAEEQLVEGAQQLQQLQAAARAALPVLRVVLEAQEQEQQVPALVEQELVPEAVAPQQEEEQMLSRPSSWPLGWKPTERAIAETQTLPWNRRLDHLLHCCCRRSCRCCRTWQD